MESWQDTAPSIPVMVTTRGLEAFLPERVDIWGVHVPMLDTPNNRPILQRTAQEDSVWWYVDHSPQRPYGNLLLDFRAIEHRILFWQTWAVGISGFHYWAVNYHAEGADPWERQLDMTPVNGDGLLIYPSDNGPVSSIRLETARDGIEDYDYLVMLSQRIRALRDQGGHEALLEEAEETRNLGGVMTSLVSFTRDGDVLREQRRDIGRMIQRLDDALEGG